ncbi:MAG: T9SS type A sorting domain-containing protein [Candidatus Latescibacteria bacterium]|nr:T9SS type A sorting domain-containing protein [Candidatus Latescibacterota bacterium]
MSFKNHTIKMVPILILLCGTIALAQVNLISPPNNSYFYNPMPLFNWADVTGATEYRIQVDDTVDFASPIIEEVCDVSEFQTAGHLPETLYYWRVIVETPPGETSDVWQFYAQTKGPDLIAPLADTTIYDRTPTFYWHVLTGASIYQLVVTPGGSVIPEIDTVIADTSFTPTANLPLGDYNWYAQAKDSFDYWSEPSESWALTIIAQPYTGWVEKESMPSGTNPKKKNVKDGGSLVAVGNDLYALRGNKSRELYKYNGSEWTLPNALESMPFGYKPDKPDKLNKKEVGKGASLCYDGDSLIYATKGNGTKEFWAYNVITDQWITKGYVPVTKALKGGTSIAYRNGKIYLLAGGQKPVDKNFFAYDVAAGSWDTLENATLNTGKPYKDGSCIVLLNDKIYAVQAGAKENYFLVYDTNSWTAKELMPLTHPNTPKKKTKVKDGAAMTSDGNVIYAIKGGKVNEFWRYTPGTTGIWAGLESIPRRLVNLKYNKQSVPKTGAALACDPDGNVYLLKGNSTNEFWQYYPTAATKERIVVNTNQTVQNLNNNTGATLSLQVSPNPISKNAVIRYSVPNTGRVSLKLFHADGRLVKTLSQTILNAGTYQFNLSSHALAKGVYFLKLETIHENTSTKLIVE